VIRERVGWDAIDAIHDGHVYEVKSTYILQPGPASLTEGVKQIHAILAHVVGVDVEPSLHPTEKQDASLTKSYAA
jgi:iron complex transport system substrate-binding protein